MKLARNARGAKTAAAGGKAWHRRPALGSPRCSWLMRSRPARLGSSGGNCRGRIARRLYAGAGIPRACTVADIQGSGTDGDPSRRCEVRCCRNSGPDQETNNQPSTLDEAGRMWDQLVLVWNAMRWRCIRPRRALKACGLRQQWIAKLLRYRHAPQRLPQLS
jgi:hypothetical protein